MGLGIRTGSRRAARLQEAVAAVAAMAAAAAASPCTSQLQAGHQEQSRRTHRGRSSRGRRWPPGSSRSKWQSAGTSHRVSCHAAQALNEMRRRAPSRRLPAKGTVYTHTVARAALRLSALVRGAGNIHTEFNTCTVSSWRPGVCGIEKKVPPALWLGLPPTSSFTVKVMSTPATPPPW